MKTKLLALLTLALMLLSFSGCSFKLPDIADSKDTDTGESDTPGTVTLPDLTISLPDEFDKIDATTFSSEDMLIRIMTVPKSSITPNEGYSFPTITEFFGHYITFKDEINFATRDGFLYTDYLTTQHNVAGIFAIPETEGTQTIFFFETDKYFFAISFYGAKMEYESAKEQAFTLIDCFTVGE